MSGRLYLLVPFSIKLLLQRLSFIHPSLWICFQELLGHLRGGVGPAFCIAYVSSSALYTFTLYPFFIEGEASLRAFFEFIPFIITLVAPSLTHELVAQEYQQKRLDQSLALPISYPQLLLGKLGGAWAIFMLGTILSLCLPLILSFYVDLYWPTIWVSYLGLVLMGSMYLCVGLWASVWAKHPLSAWLISFFICFSLYLLGLSARVLPPDLAEWAQMMSVHSHSSRFNLGVIDSRDLIYFFGMIFFWFTLAVETLRMKVNNDAY